MGAHARRLPERPLEDSNRRFSKDRRAIEPRDAGNISEGMGDARVRKCHTHMHVACNRRVCHGCCRQTAARVASPTHSPSTQFLNPTLNHDIMVHD